MKYFVYKAYVWYLAVIFVPGKYVNMTWGRCCSWACFGTYAPVLGLYTHIEWWQCGPYLQCNRHICSVTYANNMKYNLQSLHGVSCYVVIQWLHVWYLYGHTSYVCSLAGMFISCTCVIIMWSRCYRWLCFGTYMSHSWNYVPTQNEGSVLYVNVDFSFCLMIIG